MRRWTATRNGCFGAIAGWLCAAVTCAQQPGFTELRRWRWQSPEVVCGAADAAGTVAALGRRDASGAGWEVLLWDPKARAGLRTVPVAKRPIAVRFPDAAHVEVRTADTDAFFSLSHWQRFRVGDGAAVGEPIVSRVEDDDVVARKRMRAPSPVFGDDVKPGPEPCVYRETRSVSWWKDGVSIPIADSVAHAVELTPDGRFAVVWLPSRLVAMPVAGGEVHVLPVPSETIRAIAPGANGDELVVVTTDAVRVYRITSRREVHNIPFAAEHVVAAALAPGGGPLALASGTRAPVALLDLATGRVKKTAVLSDCIGWSIDGSRLACRGQSFWSIDRDGELMWAGRALKEIAELAHYVYLSVGARTAPRIVPIDGNNDAWTTAGYTVRVTRGEKQSDGPASVPFTVHALLSPRELIATDGMRLRVVDATSWESIVDHDLRAEGSAVAVATAARRVAVVAGAELVVLDVAPRK